MHSQLIIHQPYRTLNTLQSELALSADDMSLAWSVINDHYMTDLPLLYPPHTIALTAILLALTLRPSVAGAQATGSGAAGGASQDGVGVTTATAALMQAQARMQSGGNGGGVIPGLPPNTGQGNSQQPGQGDANAAFRERVQDGRNKVPRFAAWLAESSVDIEAMVDCTQELISFWECHEQYNEKFTREQINRYVKARGLEK